MNANSVFIPRMPHFSAIPDDRITVADWWTMHSVAGTGVPLEGCMGPASRAPGSTSGVQEGRSLLEDVEGKESYKHLLRHRSADGPH
jgi:hypothetical protein